MKKIKKQTNPIHVIICMVILIFGSILVTGCPIPDVIQTSADKAATIIENGMTTADFNSDQWRAEVDKIATQLDAVEPQAANDVRDILAKTVATTGTEFRCDTDFVHERVRQDLQRIADKLRKKQTTPPIPAFCQFTPPGGIDMKYRPAFVTFYGYDFKYREANSSVPGGYTETKQVKTYLVSDEGEIPLDQWTDFITHYELTVKTAPSDTIPICNKTNRHIVLRTNSGMELSSVGVAKLACPAAPSPQTPKPEILFGQYTHTFGWDFIRNGQNGATTYYEYGGDCAAGYHRTRYEITEIGKSGDAGCKFNKWVNNDEHSCKINVTSWFGVYGSSSCNTKIYESGDTPPTPAAPPCPCW
jgi:hypothetical protein